MRNYKIRDDDGTVIGQYRRTGPPEQPDEWTDGWNVEKADELNDEPVEWWDDR